MKLAIVTGFREYLLPRRVNHAALAEMLHARLPGAVVPVLRWQSSGEPLAYHDFLYDDEPTRDRAVELFIEYAADAAGPGRTAVAVLPDESALGPAVAGGARLDHFLTLARRRFAAADLVQVRLYLSDNAQAVLTRLDTLRTGRAAIATAGSPGSLDGVAIESLALAPRAADAGLLAPVRRNYRRALLDAAEQVVGRDSIFAGAGRGELLDRLLDDDPALLAADEPPDRIVEALRPGGRLFELLTRPIALPTAPVSG